MISPLSHLLSHHLSVLNGTQASFLEPYLLVRRYFIWKAIGVIDIILTAKTTDMALLEPASLIMICFSVGSEIETLSQSSIDVWLSLQPVMHIEQDVEQHSLMVKPDPKGNIFIL